jgi:hypothetical protein
MGTRIVSVTSTIFVRYKNFWVQQHNLLGSQKFFGSTAQFLCEKLKVSWTAEYFFLSGELFLESADMFLVTRTIFWVGYKVFLRSEQFFFEAYILGGTQNFLVTRTITWGATILSGYYRYFLGSAHNFLGKRTVFFVAHYI